MVVALGLLGLYELDLEVEGMAYLGGRRAYDDEDLRVVRRYTNTQSASHLSIRPSMYHHGL